MVERRSIYQPSSLPTGDTLDIAIHATGEAFAISHGATISHIDGDATRVNLLVDPGFDTDTIWSPDANWSLIGSTALHFAGVADDIQQTLTLTPGKSYRMCSVVSGRTAGAVLPALFGGTDQAGTAITTNGESLGAITAVAGNTAFGFAADSDFDGAIDETELFEDTTATATAPAGLFEYWLQPLNVDGNPGARKVLLGFDEISGLLVGAGLTDGSSGQVGTTPDVPLSGVLLVTIAAINHLILDGQSLSVGAKGQAAISLSQPYSNITFAGGPRAANGDYSSVKPLIEDDLTAPDGGTNRGETPCSGAANYATTLAARDNGVSPEDHIILASTAGHGGYRIDQLDKSAAWYSTLLDHVSGAFALNPDHAVHVLAWMQGENDAVTGTSYATYRAALEQLQVDVETDVKAINGQAGPVFCVTYQMSYRAASEPEMALAQLDLAQSNDKFYLSTPTYHIPHSSDGVHLTADGYKWVGAYIGRPYKKLVIDKVKPKWLNPLSATLRGAELRIRFDVPHRPMVLDVTSLALTQDHGFRVTDDGVTAAISTISVDGDDVVITLAATPSGEVKARYALDYLGTGLIITNAASGNLRDSQPDTVLISGVDRPLYNVCPHFELTAIKLGE